MQTAKILLPLVKLFPLDYLIPEELVLRVGDLVVVSFRNKEVTGIVWQLDTEPSTNINKIKTIQRKVPLEFTLSDNILALIKWCANYYMSELGSIAKLVLPVELSEGPVKVKRQQLTSDFTLPALSPEQEKALSSLRTSSKPSIIKGITGSGKTEVYFHLIADYLKQDKQILIMLPEIALSEQIISRFTARFGFAPVIWNSLVTKAQRKMILRGILTKEVKVIIGARSSLFLPYPNLGLIILDEEHDSSYKQDDGVLYNARDIAILKGSISQVQIVLCSATPSIETIYNASQNKYQLIELSSRHQGAVLPDIQLIDMAKEKLPKNFFLSDTLKTAMHKNLANNEQILLFLNRRGYSPLLLCKLCGYRFTCNSCSSWLVVHKSNHKLLCHHCGQQSKIHDTCPDCLEHDSLTVCGPGIERIEEEVKHFFPTKRISIISKDHVQSSEKMRELLNKMVLSEIDILIGTQLITKGYHFPNLTLVGVIDADLNSATAGDLRSSERTYQLLHQVGGRAGRENKKGLVLLQTYYPDNIIFNQVQDGGDQFFQHELMARKDSDMPPYTKMASIILSGINEHKILAIANNLVAAAPKSKARILGPSSALMSKLAGKFRYRILVIADKKFDLQNYLRAWLGQITFPSSCKIKIDIDPMNFY